MMGCGGYHISSEVDEEYEKLVVRMNPPRVTVDNTSSSKATLVKVDSANRQGSLLEVVQVLTDLKLSVKRAYISSDGEWFMDVFHVVDQDGNKLSDEGVVDRIEKSLEARALGHQSIRSVGVQAEAKHTSVELIGRDRPGLLSEVFAVLTNLNCNVVAAEAWTHNSRMASVIYVTDEVTGAPIDDPERLSKIRHLLLYLLGGNGDKQTAKTATSVDSTHAERRLHQMMFADHPEYQEDGIALGGAAHDDKNKPLVTVGNCAEKDYTVVNIRSKDRPKLIFDTVCTLTDMQYVVFHATVIAEAPEAHQEYFIRKVDGLPVSSEEERTRLVACLEAAIKRRTTEGLRLELCCEDRVGLLSDVTRIFRENGLSVLQAEVSTRGSQAANAFYVVDASGNPVQSHMIDAVRSEIGQTILHVKDAAAAAAGAAAGASSPPEENGKFSLGTLFKSRSEKFLYNLGLIRSHS